MLIRVIESLLLRIEQLLKLSAGGLTHSGCLAFKAFEFKVIEIFVAQGRAVAEIISGWTYTLRMPSTQSF